jgi:hypothetical protein
MSIYTYLCESMYIYTWIWTWIHVYICSLGMFEQWNSDYFDIIAENIFHIEQNTYKHAHIHISMWIYAYTYMDINMYVVHMYMHRAFSIYTIIYWLFWYFCWEKCNWYWMSMSLHIYVHRYACIYVFKYTFMCSLSSIKK